MDDKMDQIAKLYQREFGSNDISLLNKSSVLDSRNFDSHTLPLARKLAKVARDIKKITGKQRISAAEWAPFGVTKKQMASRLIGKYVRVGNAIQNSRDKKRFTNWCIENQLNPNLVNADRWIASKNKSDQYPQSHTRDTSKDETDLIDPTKSILPGSTFALTIAIDEFLKLGSLLRHSNSIECKLLKHDEGYKIEVLSPIFTGAHKAPALASSAINKDITYNTKRDFYIICRDAVLHEQGLSLSELCSKTKAVRIVAARQLLYYLCHRRAIPLSEIQSYLLDDGFSTPHTSIMHGIKSMKLKIKEDKGLAELANRIFDMAI